MSDKSTRKVDFGIFKRLLAHAKPYRLYLILSLLFTIILAGLAPLNPSILGYAINTYAVAEETQNAEKLMYWIMLAGGVLMLQAVFMYFSTYFSNLLAQSIIRDLRKKLYKHMVGFKMKYFDKTPIGTIVTRSVSDIEAVSEVFSQGLINIIGDLLSLTAILGFMIYMDATLTLLVLIPIPLLLIATRIFAKAMKSAFQKERVAVNRLNTFVQERLTGMAILQMFSREKIENKKFDDINKAHLKSHIDAIWAFSIFFPLVEILSSLSISALLVYMAVLVSGEDMESKTNLVGTVLSFTMYVSLLYRPIRQLADKFNVLQRGIVRAERVFETLDLTEHIDNSGQVANVDFQQTIHLEDVNFAYVNEDWVLKNINLDIQPNSTVAFVGATGAGKSSIVNLLARFYEFQKGSIKVGDTDIREMKLDYLRRNISIVLQDVFLFSDSIHNNITLGDEGISRERVIEAAKEVGAHDFIMRLPGNYDYQVGERGGVLSVGQRQLLSFIRAYVYNPHILVLDEATSSVDGESEELIQKATEKLTAGRTSIVIAHRLSTIQNADKIVVLEKGEIVEQGNHQSLLEQDGYYKNLYEKQFLENEK